MSRRLSTAEAIRAGPQRVVTAKRATVHLRGRTLPLSYGTVLPVTGRNAQGNWLVRTPDGPGWVTSSSFHLPSAPTGSSIVVAAKRFLGLRYLWGGVSSWGFDCSGLVWDVFRAHGVTVPRDAGPHPAISSSTAPRPPTWRPSPGGGR
jgi:cell wall-associated NlpC family hydrolase